jgi:acyl carrier protein
VPCFRGRICRDRRCAPAIDVRWRATAGGRRALLRAGAKPRHNLRSRDEPMNEVLDKLMKLAARRYTVPLESIAPSDDLFERLRIDSFQAVELMSEIEMEFDVEVPDYELQGVRTFEALASVIDKRR